jgi:glycosyltransferase involved in cell wall biosynthesis
MPVSVIMATYNGQNFLKEQIDSIMSQLNIDDELIILDDCSSDKSIQIISEYLFENSEKFIDEYKSLLPDLVALSHDNLMDERGEIYQ